VRMEPVFMVLGQSAAVAAGMAMDAELAVQEVPVPKLQTRLRELGQALEWKGGGSPDSASAPLIAPGSLPGIVLDDADGKKTGAWSASARAVERRVGTGYLHDGNAAKGEVSITWTPDLPADGEYEIFLIAPPNPNRATNAPVTLAVEGREPVTVRVNMRGEEGTGFLSLGKHALPKGKKTTVTLSNRETDGYVVADGVQFLPK